MLRSLKRYAGRLQAEPTKPLLVLVVDDDQAVRDFVDRVLGTAGYPTMVAASRPEAIELAGKEPIDEKTTLWQDDAYLEKPCTIAGCSRPWLSFQSATSNPPSPRACASRGAGSAGAC